MGKLFNYDSPFWRGMNKIADVIVLNLLTILFSIPLVTVGAAVTALYDAMWKLQREEGSVWNNYWTAFKSNFRQATILWLITAVISAAVGFGMAFYMGIGLNNKPVFLMLSLLLLLLWGGLMSWVFPLQSRFYNTVKSTLQNAFLCSVAYFPRTLGMLVMNGLPAAVFFTMPMVFIRSSISLFLFYFALAAYVNCRLLKKPVEGMIEKIRQQETAETET